MALSGTGTTDSHGNLAQSMAAIPTALAKEILNELGIDRVHLRGISAIVTGSKSIAGPASTLRYLPQREDLPKAPRGPVGRRAFDELERGAVLVIDAMGAQQGAVVGDMLGARASFRGAAGAVVDGVIRDVAGLRALGLPVFARGIHPDPNGMHLMPWERDIPIQCGGCLVQPGDWILADEDGALVIPAQLATTVADAGTERLHVDELSQQLLSNGAALDEAYPPPPNHSDRDLA